MAQFQELNCSIHGLTIHRKRLKRHNSWACKLCANAFESARRTRNKLKLIKYHGGKCIWCGYNKHPSALVFHHRDPEDKKFGVGERSRPYKALLKESLKCDLICQNCHHEFHNENGFLA